VQNQILKLTSVFQFIRWKNLVIVILTLWATRSVLDVDVAVCPVFAMFYFALLTLSFVCITAAGNMHNDILDIGIDKINKPLRQVVNESISIKHAAWYALFSFVLGLVSIIVLSMTFDRHIWIFYYLFFGLLLYLYNTWLKCQPLVGNVLVSILCGCVVMAPLLMGCDFIGNLKEQNGGASFFVVMYSVMAVILNFMRELIKDMEDIKGDEELRCKTFPVSFGEERSRLIIYIVSISFVAAFLFVLNTLTQYFDISFVYLAGLIIGLPYIMFLTSFYKNDVGGYRKAQQWLKVMLLAGLLVLTAM
jgi:4-hydroxybenzoate polyprenyltransferase